MTQDSIHQQLSACYKKAFMGRLQPFAVTGALLILIGSVSLILPMLFANILLVTDGYILVFAGASTLIALLSAPQQAGFRLSLFGILGLCAGVCLIRIPAINVISPSFFFAAYFSLAGITTLLFAGSYRCQHSECSQWLTVSSFMSFNLAFISLSGLPAAFTWTFCVFLGLHLIFHGSALFAASLAVVD
jgi:uncharacterized membrane protein HdeD (DUF308 family)